MDALAHYSAMRDEAVALAETQRQVLTSDEKLQMHLALNARREYVVECAKRDEGQGDWPQWWAECLAAIDSAIGKL